MSRQQPLIHCALVNICMNLKHQIRDNRVVVDFNDDFRKNFKLHPNVFESVKLFA